MKQKKVKTTKKKVSTTQKKSLTRADLISKAIKDYKMENPDWKKHTRDDMYAIESNIDALLYENKFQHIAPGYGKIKSSNLEDEMKLESLTFQAIRAMSGRRHSCDPYYDDAFEGYDCTSEVIEHSSKEHKHSNKKSK